MALRMIELQSLLYDVFIIIIYLRIFLLHCPRVNVIIKVVQRTQ